MKSILLFGSSGFIGQHLTRSLHSQGYQVVASKLRADSFEREVCLKEMQAVDGVINAAGLAHAQSGVHTEESYLQINAEFPTNIARCAIESGVQRFVHISSVKAAQYEPGSINSELNTMLPADSYGRSKRQGEQNLLALDWQSCQCTILRPGLVFGPAVKANLRALLKALRNRLMPRIKSSGERSMVSVNDLCSAVIQCLRKPPTRNDVYIVVEPESYTISRVQDAVDRALGRRTALIGVSAPMLFRVARRIDRLFSLFTSQAQKGHGLSSKCAKLVEQELYSSDKFASEYAWQSTVRMERLMPEMLASLSNTARAQEAKPAKEAGEIKEAGENKAGQRT